MKNFKNVMKKVTVGLFILVFMASIALNIYQYIYQRQTVNFVNDIMTMVDDSVMEASENMSISDQLMLENVIERNCSDEKLEEVVNKYGLLK